MQSIWWAMSISESNCWNMAKILNVHQSDVWLHSFLATIPQKSEIRSCESIPFPASQFVDNARWFTRWWGGEERRDAHQRAAEQHWWDWVWSNKPHQFCRTQCGWLRVYSGKIRASLVDFCSSVSFIPASRCFLCKKKKKNSKIDAKTYFDP